MSFLRNMTSGLRSLFRKEQVDRELDEELRAYQEMAAEEKMKDGMSRKEALRAVRLERGSLEVSKEIVRSGRWEFFLETCSQDLRFAGRILRKSPGFTAVAAFQQMALIEGGDVNLTDSSEPERLPAARVSPGLFSILGVQPQLGRGFLNEEDVPGRDHVVLISNELWRGRYSADPHILGRTISIDGVVHEIVGVLPANFHFPKLSALYPITILGEKPQIWKPIALRPDELTPTGGFNFVSIGRLKAGITSLQAASELDAIEKSFSAQVSKVLGSDLRSHVVPLKDRIVGRARSGLDLMLMAVGTVLFIGCLNIMNLLLARFSSRRRELAVRSAIGASRWRLTRQMIIESLTLSAIGGACGLFVAYLGVRLFLAFAPFDVPRLDEVHVDMRVVIFALFVSAVAGLVIGISAAWQFSAAEMAEVMPSGTRSTSGRGVGRLRSAVVSAQVALGAVCLIASALLLESLVNLLNVDRGFDARQVVTVGVNPPDSRYPTLEKRAAFVRTVLDDLRVLPGVTSVAAANMLPLGGEGGNSALFVAGTNTPLFEHALGNIRTANSDYFRTMGMSLQAGRLFNDSDQQLPVAVISNLIAKRAWPGENPIGKRFHFGPPSNPDWEVVGVVNDVRGVSLEAGPSFNVYVPYWQAPFTFAIEFALKTRNDPAAIAPAIRSVIRNIDAELPVSSLRTMDQIVEGSVAQRRFRTYLVLAFGAAAVLLACLGIYGVMSFFVTQRTTEIGIRLAFGAEPREVLRMVLRQAMRPVAVGVAVAVPLSFLAGSWLRSLVFGVSPQDPKTIAVACFVLVVAAALAAYLPARRAMHVDPIVALRYE